MSCPNQPSGGLAAYDLGEGYGRHDYHGNLIDNPQKVTNMTHDVTTDNEKLTADLTLFFHQNHQF